MASDLIISSLCMHTNTELMIMFIDILAVFAERTVAPRFAACESTEREKERGKKVLLFREERKKEGRERERKEKKEAFHFYFTLLL